MILYNPLYLRSDPVLSTSLQLMLLCLHLPLLAFRVITIINDTSAYSQEKIENICKFIKPF